MIVLGKDVAGLQIRWIGRTLMVKWKEKLKQLPVKTKLQTYRTLIIIITLVMGAVALGLSLLMDFQVRKITNNWSPTLARVMETNTLTSDYRMKQYGHLVSTTDAEMTAYETELTKIEQDIETVCAAFEADLSTEEEEELYSVIRTKWDEYKSASAEVLELSRQNKMEQGNKLMTGEMLDVYNDFQDSFAELKTYEENQLAKAKANVVTMFWVMVVVIVAIVIVAIMLVTSLGKLLITLITEPVAQITEAARRMYGGDMSAGSLITYESTDEFGVVSDALRGAMKNLADYIEEISGNLREIAKGDLTKQSDEITDFLGDFADIKESFVYILKKFNVALTEIQNTSDQVASNAGTLANSSRALSEGATDQASAIEELTATINTVANLAEESAKNSQQAYEDIRLSADKAEQEKQKMEELTEEMRRITEISREIENIITAIEEIASQTNLLSLNASIEAARAGEAGKGFAVVADQIGKLAADSAQSAVDTRELIGKTLEEIEKGNAITASTSEAFDRVIEEMKDFAKVAQSIKENVTDSAQALEQVEQGIEQISAVMQNTAEASQECTSISDSLSDESGTLDELVKEFKLY